MSHSSHNLASEFPELKEKIHSLRQSNLHFQNLFKRYEEIDDKISRAEQRLDLISEGSEETLRKERLQLKDQLYAMLQAAA